jgi:hypothetical protein
LIDVAHHGLPPEHHTEDDASEDWETVLGYLRALEKCRLPIFVAISEADSFTNYSEQIGYLRTLGPSSKDPTTWQFQLHWPSTAEPIARVTLPTADLRRASLSTDDGDDFFVLALQFGTVRVCLQESVTSFLMSSNDGFVRMEAEDMPTAEEITKQWQEDAARDERGAKFAKTIREQVARFRVQLVKRGALQAEEMSEAEIYAAMIRVNLQLKKASQGQRWKSRDHMDEIVDELARELREHAAP